MELLMKTTYNNTMGGISNLLIQKKRYCVFSLIFLLISSSIYAEAYYKGKKLVNSNEVYYDSNDLRIILESILVQEKLQDYNVLNARIDKSSADITIAVKVNENKSFLIDYSRDKKKENEIKLFFANENFLAISFFHFNQLSFSKTNNNSEDFTKLSYSTASLNAEVIDKITKDSIIFFEKYINMDDFSSNNIQESQMNLYYPEVYLLWSDRGNKPIDIYPGTVFSTGNEYYIVLQGYIVKKSFFAMYQDIAAGLYMPKLNGFSISLESSNVNVYDKSDDTNYQFVFYMPVSKENNPKYVQICFKISCQKPTDTFVRIGFQDIISEEYWKYYKLSFEDMEINEDY